MDTDPISVLLNIFIDHADIVSIDLERLMNDKIEAMERLANLADEGRITEDEYETLKRELLGDDRSERFPDDLGPVETPDYKVRQPPGWYTANEQSREHYWDGQKWTGSVRARSDGNDHEDSEPPPDMYEIALSEESEPDRVGWFPDPDQLGTHMRFYDGNDWTESVRQRKAPGWYPDSERQGRERYFNGLEYTYNYRQAKKTSSRATARPSVRDQPKNWRFWVGLILVILGGLAVVGGIARFNNERIQTLEVLALHFALDPLIWGGIIGGFLLLRWREPTDRRQDQTPKAYQPPSRRDAFWFDQ